MHLLTCDVRQVSKYVNESNKDNLIQYTVLMIHSVACLCSKILNLEVSQICACPCGQEKKHCLILVRLVLWQWRQAIQVVVQVSVCPLRKKKVPITGRLLR